MTKLHRFLLGSGLDYGLLRPLPGGKWPGSGPAFPRNYTWTGPGENAYLAVYA